MKKSCYVIRTATNGLRILDIEDEVEYGCIECTYPLKNFPFHIISVKKNKDGKYESLGFYSAVMVCCLCFDGGGCLH